MHDAYIGGRSENNIKCVVHDDLGQKNQTTRYISRLSATSLAKISAVSRKLVQLNGAVFNRTYFAGRMSISTSV